MTNTIEMIAQSFSTSCSYVGPLVVRLTIATIFEYTSHNRCPIYWSVLLTICILKKGKGMRTLNASMPYLVMELEKSSAFLESTFLHHTEEQINQLVLYKIYAKGGGNTMPIKSWLPFIVKSPW